MNLKKITYIAFVTLFTVITIGITVNKHYSGGKLFSFAIFGEPESCCAGVCNCCHEESEIIQFHADYTFSVDSLEPSSPEIELFAFAIASTISKHEVVLTNTRIIDQDLPPPDQLTNLSLLQTFLL